MANLETQGAKFGDSNNTLWLKIATALQNAELYDPDAAAFFAAAGITDATQKSAVNQLVLDLKDASLWTLMYALYPFVGGAATPHSYNLKNPAVGQITWSGTVTHNADGITPDGVSGYGDTGIARNALPQTLIHFSTYLRTLPSDLNMTYIGADNFGTSTQFSELFGGGGTASFRNSGNGAKADTADMIGFLIGSRSATDDQIMRAGVSVFTAATNPAPTANLALNVFIGALNRNGAAANYSDANLAFISAGDELSEAQALTFRTAVDAFQTTLGRNV